MARPASPGQVLPKQVSLLGRHNRPSGCQESPEITQALFRLCSFSFTKMTLNCFVFIGLFTLAEILVEAAWVAV